MKIFPNEILEHTTQYFIPKNSVKSKAIYGLVLIIVIMAFCSLPFISMPIYSSARGLVKADIECLPITSINSGKVVFSVLENNNYVSKNETLIVLETSVLDEQLKLLSKWSFKTY